MDGAARVEDFDLERTPDGDRVRVRLSGPELLRSPLYNKGIGFTPDERRRFGIEGMLPARHNDIDTQAERTYRTICFNPDPVGRNIDLSLLLNRNEVLFYRILSRHLAELMPVIYTPTVGEASRYYSHVYRRARGIFITPDHRGRIEEVLRNSAPFSGVELMVVTDNEAILGIGDQGVGGMAISIGKLALYCVGAGIHPARTLPVSLDVGTDNETLLNDPMYIGWPRKRLQGDEYLDVVDEFVAAARAVFPDAVIQWEDFRKDNALAILDRHRHTLPSFNDDIQGTGAVAAACVRAACRLRGSELRDCRTLVYGAGAAGLGIVRQLRDQLREAGLTGDALAGAVLAMDSRGIVSDDRQGLDDYKREIALPAARAAELGLSSADERLDLARVVAASGVNVLIGTSGQGGSFDEDVVTAMCANAEHPVILPMSNPTTISEGHPQDIADWSGGRALVATGSPFEPVLIGNDRRRIGQANNVFVFPGIGLGAIVTRAREVTDSMVAAASTALAESLDDDDIRERSLMPAVDRLWEICGDVALAVARRAIADGVAERISDGELEARLAASRWKPTYPEIVLEGA